MRALALILALAAAGPANALSCLRPDIANAYALAAESEDRYITVLGNVIFDSGDLTRRGNRPDPVDRSTSGRFVGQSFALDGTLRPYSAEITVTSACWASWCGSPLSGREFLGFLKLTGDRAELIADPCGGFQFYDPSDKDIRRLSTCMAGGPCS